MLKERKKMTQQTKDNIRKALTGRSLSLEHRKKIGKITKERVKRGEIGFKKGYHPTKEHLERLSESHKDQIAWNKGKKMDQEFRDKCRERQLGIKQSPKTIEKRVSQMRGKNHWRWMKDRTSVNMNERRWNTKACVEWREAIFTRDSHKCRIENEDCCVYVEAHHILNWRDHPELRFNINNGITLCRAHHPRKRAEEKRLIPTFQELVSVSIVPQL